MEKIRWAFLIIVLALLINMVNASYVCSDNSTIREDVGEIDIGKRSVINGLPLGLTNADEAFATRKIFVDLIIDAVMVNLTNTSSSKVVNFTDGKSYTIQMINATDLGANIKVGSSSISFMEKDDVTTIGGAKIFLFKTQGYPKELRVDLLAGVGTLSLDNTDNKEKIVKLNGEECLVDLYSSSDDDTVIRVRRCENFSAKLIKINDNLSSEQNITIAQNNTNNSTNKSEINNTDIEQNQTSNESIGNQLDVKESKIVKYVSIGAGIILVIIFLILGITYMKNKATQEAVEQKTGSIGPKDVSGL